jgi:hypothetical protein
LAEEIIAGQQAEIAAMKARLEILRKGADPSPGGFPSLGGTRGTVEAYKQARSGSKSISLKLSIGRPLFP